METVEPTTEMTIIQGIGEQPGLQEKIRYNDPGTLVGESD